MPEKDGLSSLEICPVCKELMEHGYIITSRLLKWCDHVPNFVSTHGEVIDRSYFGFAYLEGFRCRKRQIIRYIRKNQTLLSIREKYGTVRSQYS